MIIGQPLPAVRPDEGDTWVDFFIIGRGVRA